MGDDAFNAVSSFHFFRLNQFFETLLKIKTVGRHDMLFAFWLDQEVKFW